MKTYIHENDNTMITEENGAYVVSYRSRVSAGSGSWSSMVYFATMKTQQDAQVLCEELEDSEREGWDKSIRPSRGAVRFADKHGYIGWNNRHYKTYRRRSLVKDAPSSV